MGEARRRVLSVSVLKLLESKESFVIKRGGLIRGGAADVDERKPGPL